MMVKQKKRKILNYPIFWLLIGAIFIEVLNIIVTSSLGMAQQDICPKSAFPAELSLYLGAASVLFIITIVVIAKNKITAVALLLFWVVLVFLIGWFLRYVAHGGIDWCSFLGS